MEQNPRDWWAALTSVCQQLLEGQHARVAALAIGGQAPTLTAVDAELEPTHPAITWLDRRPAVTAEKLYAGLGQGVPIWGSWPAQIAWFARTRPDAFQRSRWLLSCPDYLTARLTGETTLALAWPAAEMEAASVDPRRVPAAVKTGEIVGIEIPLAAE